MKRFIYLFILFFAQTLFAAEGCLIIVELKTGEIVKKEGKCEQRVAPASTFKIPLSVMGFDSGILKTANLPEWPYDKKYRAALDSHQQAQTPATWLTNSAVWYSQMLTTQLGMERFRQYVQNFQYGNQNLSGDIGKNNGLTHSWLGSSLAVSPTEQIVFISKMLKEELPASKYAQEATRDILPTEKLPHGWTIAGKTGTGPQLGWFVGWATRGDDVLVFAKLIRDDNKKAPTKLEDYAGPRAREAFKKEFISFVENS